MESCNTGKVFVVHCIDTEGPLDESITETFRRIEEISGLHLVPSEDTLRRIQEKQIDLSGKEEMLANIFSKRLLSYNRDISSIHKMLEEITSDNYRMRYVDSFGGGWKYSWFIMDHIDYEVNPRYRLTGYNGIYDLYKEFYMSHNIKEDEFQWHVHAGGTYKEGNRSGHTYWNSRVVMESLAHRLIDRGDFPSAVIAGMWTESADSHWLFEQYFPYDFTNKACKVDYLCQDDIQQSRNASWDRAKSDWSWYHPSHDDYQTEGNCRRTIFRSLNVSSRVYTITQEDVYQAFDRANKGEDTVLAIDGHDFRDMRYDIKEVYEYIIRAKEKYHDVQWKNETASTAAHTVLKEKRIPITLDIDINTHSSKRMSISIEANISSFGVEPFFSIKMRGGRYMVERLMIIEPFKKWKYVFDDNTVIPDDVECVGIATNSQCGTGALRVLTLNGLILQEKQW